VGQDAAGQGDRAVLGDAVLRLPHRFQRAPEAHAQRAGRGVEIHRPQRSDEARRAPVAGREDEVVEGPGPVEKRRHRGFVVGVQRGAAGAGAQPPQRILDLRRLAGADDHARPLRQRAFGDRIADARGSADDDDALSVEAGKRHGLVPIRCSW
jgi:hypothetical protein